MLYCTSKKLDGFVSDVDACFNKLNFANIRPYIYWLSKQGVFIDNFKGIRDSINVCEVYAKTILGYCNLSNISTSLKIIILCQEAIRFKRPFSFHYALLGGNFVELLYRICRNTNLIALYTPNKRLAYTGVSLELIKELLQNVR